MNWNNTADEYRVTGDAPGLSSGIVTPVCFDHIDQRHDKNEAGDQKNHTPRERQHVVMSPSRCHEKKRTHDKKNPTRQLKGDIASIVFRLLSVHNTSLFSVHP